MIFILLLIFCSNRIAGFHNKTGAHSPISLPPPLLTRCLKPVCNVNIGSAPTKEKAWGSTRVANHAFLAWHSSFLLTFTKQQQLGNSIRYWNNGSPVQYHNATVLDWDAGCRNTNAGSIALNADSQLWEIGTSKTNHPIMELVGKTRTPSLGRKAWRGALVDPCILSGPSTVYSVGPSYWRAHTGQCTIQSLYS